MRFLRPAAALQLYLGLLGLLLQLQVLHGQHMPSVHVVRLGSEFANAMADNSVDVIELEWDIILRDEDWQSFNLPVVLSRNVTVRPSERTGISYVIDFNNVKHKVQLTPGHELVVLNLVGIRGRAITSRAVTGTDLLVVSPPPGPGEGRPIVKTIGGGAIYPVCLTGRLQTAANALLRRPAELTGRQITAVAAPRPACAGPFGDIRVQPMDWCWPLAVNYTDLGVDAMVLDAAGVNSISANYYYWMMGTFQLCPRTVDEACLKTNTPITCLVMALREVDPLGYDLPIWPEWTPDSPPPVAGGGAAAAGEPLPVLAGPLPPVTELLGLGSPGAAEGAGLPPPTGSGLGPGTLPPRGVDTASAAPGGGAAGAEDSGDGGVPLYIVLPAVLGGVAVLALAALGAFAWRRRSRQGQQLEQQKQQQHGDAEAKGSWTESKAAEGDAAPSSGTISNNASSDNQAAPQGGPASMAGSGASLPLQAQPPGALQLPAFLSEPDAETPSRDRHGSGAGTDLVSLPVPAAAHMHALPVTKRTPLCKHVRMDLRWGADIAVRQHAVRGAGAFGRVLEGECYGLPVAVKVLHLNPSQRAAPKPAIEALKQEAEVLSRCSHPNIVVVLGACLTPPHLCLVMELMEQSLEQLMDEQPDEALPLAQVLQIAMDVAQGLAYLHPTVVHRDLKPANVLLDKDGAAKLSDFGLARLRETVCETMHPEAGTAPYMAPECFDPSNLVITHKADIYSWAVVVWQMLWGAPPWAGLSPLAIAFAVTYEGKRLPMWQFPRSRCPRRLQELLGECWDADPQRRPSAEELVKRLALLQQSLERVLSGKGSAAPPPSLTPELAPAMALSAAYPAPASAADSDSAIAGPFAGTAAKAASAEPKGAAAYEAGMKLETTPRAGASSPAILMPAPGAEAPGADDYPDAPLPPQPRSPGREQGAALGSPTLDTMQVALSLQHTATGSEEARQGAGDSAPPPAARGCFSGFSPDSSVKVEVDRWAPPPPKAAATKGEAAQTR